MDGISCSSVCRCAHRRCSFLFTNFSLSVLYFPLQVAVCIWFLYNILGWSAFVGMVVMIALFPIPGVLAGKIQKVQRESTKRVSILPYQCFDVGVYVAARRMHVCRLLQKVKSQSPACAVWTLIIIIYSYEHSAHDQAVRLGA
jgi:uncharacterized membrane protein